MKGRYASGRDAVLSTLCEEGYANDGDGDVESPTGWFWWIEVTESWLADVMRDMPDLLTEYDVKPADLIGSFIVTDDNYGFVTVTEYESRDIVYAYNELLARFIDWDS